RERLRGRLARRGLVTSTGLLTVARSSEATSTPIPPGLLATTVRASLRFLVEPATAVGLSSFTAVALPKGGHYEMMSFKFKVLGAVALGCILAAGGIRTFMLQAGGTGKESNVASSGEERRRESDEAAKGDSERLQGKWVVTRTTFEGGPGE